MKLVVLTLVLSLVACTAIAPPVPPNFEGFEAFASAREFDGPGTIYKITDGKRFTVATVDLSTRDVGVEVIPKFARKHNLSLDQFLKTLGVSATLIPASATANVSASNDIVIEATRGNRIRNDDDRVVLEALEKWKPRVKPPAGDEYFLVREVIRTTKFKYSVSNNWLGQIGLDVQSLKSAGYKGSANIGQGATLSLDGVFDNPLNIYYKAQRISFDDGLGVGPGNFIIKLGPAQQGKLGL